MSLNEYDIVPQSTSTAIQNYDEPEEAVSTSIYAGMSWMTFPQAGKNNALFTDRLKSAGKGRDPVTDAMWETVDPASRARLKQLLEDVVVVTRKENRVTVEEFFFLQPKLLPVTTYTTWGKQPDSRDPQKTRSVKFGGRQLNRYDVETKQDVLETACLSYDGAYPNVNFVGINSFTGQLNAPYHTGLGKNVPTGPSCLECPFSNWALYGGGKPQCGQRHVFVAWMPAQEDLYGNVMSDRLVLISGPYSVQAALNGPKAGDKYGHATRSMIGFEKIMQRSGKTTVLVAADDELSNIGNPRLVVGFAENGGKNGKLSLEQLNGAGYIEIKEGTCTTLDEVRAKALELQTAGKIGTITHIAIENEQYMYAPEGLDKAIYPVEVVSVINALPANAQRIPLLSLKGDDGQFIFPALSPRMKEKFLAAKQRAAELHDQWKLQTILNRDLVMQKLANADTAPRPISAGPAEIPSED